MQRRQMLKPGELCRSLGQNDYKKMSWKNGIGQSEQIAIFPPGRTYNDQFVWRLSVSSIKNACSFSLYPQHERTMVLLGKFDGDGKPQAHGNDCTLTLFHNGESNGKLRNFSCDSEIRSL